MSLQLIAKQMEAKGRKGDSMLVHMTPEEVAGLQKLAESAGGSLTVNPETGLVEANFLKRMLPTLVGIGVGAVTMNPMLGAAAGAAVGGYQAKRNDQDVGVGMLMGGLGGYGGAGLGAGLGAAGATGTAAQAISNPALAGQVATGAGSQASMLAAQNAGFGAQGTASLAQAAGAATPSTMAPLTQGISALGKEAGRDAFMSQVGGGAGLAKTAVRAAAPMLMPNEQKMAAAPEDDEMYSYTFNPGRTGAERTPSATSSERQYFQSSFSPMRRIRAQDYAAQGGLMRLAKGGETTSPSESDAALAYLMGEDSGSSAGLPAMASQAPVVGGDNMYAFDPVTGTFLRNPNVKGAKSAAVGSRVGTSFAGRGGDDAPQISQQTKDFFDRENFLQREARMGEVNNILSLGPLAQVANALTGSGFKGRAPNFGLLFGTSDEYKNLSDENVNVFAGRTSFLDPQQRAEQRAQNSSGEGNSGRTDFSSTYTDRGGGSFDYSADTGYDKAAGGLLSLAKGGMKSGGFVVPADVVSMIGEGNTDAGYSRIKSMVPGATAIKGKDGGQADTVKTHIEGKQPARVAHGEMYIPPETVKRMGGAKKLYAMMDRVREQATGSKKQIKPVSLKQAMA